VVWDLPLSGEFSCFWSPIFTLIFLFVRTSTQEIEGEEQGEVEQNTADARSPFANGATFVAFEMAMRAMA
jgi:hypothetical protein